MLVTPSHFVPLHAPQPGAHEHIFVFRGGALLVRESDLALPDEAACLALGVPLAQSRAVGMLGEHYCRAVWVDAGAAEPADRLFMDSTFIKAHRCSGGAKGGMRFMLLASAGAAGTRRSTR